MQGALKAAKERLPPEVDFGQIHIVISHRRISMRTLARKTSLVTSHTMPTKATSSSPFFAAAIAAQAPRDTSPPYPRRASEALQGPVADDEGRQAKRERPSDA